MRDVSFDFPIPYDAGVRPRVATAGGSVVEVHQSPSAATLWYHVGSLTGDLVTFGGSHQYDSGITPAVALNGGGVVVEVHETQSPFSSAIYYHVGQVDAAARSIDFGGSHAYDSGKVPAVALNDQNVVVEVHESDGLSTWMWYHVGRVDPAQKTIAFGASHQYDVGSTPSIALNNQNVVVEVHRSDGLATALWYHVGVVDPGSLTIDFGPSVQYDDGADPSVALTDDGFVIEVHRSQTFNTLWRRIGQVDLASRKINWIFGSVYYAGGEAPAVGTDGATAVEVHQVGTTLYDAASMVMDRTSWMHDRLALLGGHPLRNVVMPASHDAGMSTTQDCLLASDCNTRTQRHSILGQLQAGSRYFDVRPVLYGGVLYTGHYDLSKGLGCNGQALADVLDDVNAYLQEGRDLVVLKFSHYYDRDAGGGFGDAQMTQLLDQVTAALQPVLYSQPVPSDGLASVTVGEYLANGGTVLAVFDGLSQSLQSQYTGVYSYADKGGSGDLVVFDEYSNTNDLDGMITKQLAKLDNSANHGDDSLFLLSWTLTQSPAQAVTCITGVQPSILDLAQQAGAALWPALVGAYQHGMITTTLVPNLVYVDDLQGMMADFAVWLNQQLLG